MEIIKYGVDSCYSTVKVRTCPTCHCKFSYNNSDIFEGIEYNVVRCPCCGKMLRTIKSSSATVKILKFVFKFLGVVVLGIFGLLITILTLIIKAK